MNTVEELRELRKETNQSDVDLAALEKRLIRAIKDVFDQHLGFLKDWKSSPSASGSEISNSKASMEDLSPLTFQRSIEFQHEEESRKISNSDVESDVEEEDESEADQSEIKPDAIDVLQIENCAREGMVVQTAGTMVEKEAVDLNSTVPVVESVATIDQRLHKEELAGEFEAFLTKAARELQTTNDVWVLGLIEEQKFEPLYYLMMGTDQLGSELESEQLGPPPWSRGLNIKDKSRDPGKLNGTFLEVVVDGDFEGKHFAFDNRIQPKEKEDKVGNQHGSTLMLLGPIFWLNQHGPESVIFGPTSYPKFVARGLGNLEGEMKRFGPSIKQLGPPPWIGYEFGEAVRLQPPEFPSSLCREHNCKQRCFWPPLPPPAKTPPRPPDFPSDFSRLEFSTPVSDSLSIPYPISVHICGKVDAAGDDPGDIRFHQFLSLAFVFSSVQSLEDKACFERLAREVIQVEGESLVLPPPAEPPPIRPCDLEFIVKRHRQHKLWIMTWYGDSKTGDYTSLGDMLLEEENHVGNRTLKLFNDSPRPPELEDEGERRMFKWAPTRVKGGRESNDLSYDEFPHSLFKATSPKKKHEVGIESEMEVNAEAWKEGKLLTDLLHLVYNKEDYISHKELQLQLILMFDQAGSSDTWSLQSVIPRSLFENQP